VTDEYKAFVPSYYKALDKFYAENSGPFLLGERITYADFAVYQSIDNDSQIGALPDALPERLTEFKTAFEGRPRIAAYLASRRNR
jgi:glutathione S-transferase